MSGVLFAVVAAMAVTLVVVAVATQARVVAQPDEWLLRVRDGKLVQAGVGIALWRVPGDVVARFTSTVQRVRFDVEVCSRDQVHIRVEGFVLWSVDGEGDRPFVAFRKLGLNNLANPQSPVQSRRHLLTTPQHRAFRQLLTAALQRRTARMGFLATLQQQDAIVEGLREELQTFERDVGIRVERVELLRVHPVDADLLARLSAEVEETTRKHAAQIAIEASEQVQQRQLDSDARIAEQRSNVRARAQAQEAALRLEEVNRR
ncbi:MAG: SPFH domain-containing protein, partial [Myxococcota bacterium]